jgi:arginyl-tRNA synthetase
VIRITRDLAGRLTRAIQAAQRAGELPDFEIPQLKITSAAQPAHGDYASNAAMQIQGPAGMQGKSRQIAEILVSHFERADYLAGHPEIAGPGFINFRLSEPWVQQQVERILAEGESFGQMDDFAGKRAQVECVSANPTGPLHVGRMRGGVIGDTLARLLKAMGYEVEMEYYFNDAGRQMQLLGESVRARYMERLGLPSEFPADGYKGTYLYEIADALIAERGTSLAEEESWQPFKLFGEQAIFAIIKQTLGRLQMEFDTYFNENSLYEDGSVAATLKRLDGLGLTYVAMQAERDEGFKGSNKAEEALATATGAATWLRMRKLRETPQDVALVRSTGEPTYRLPDIAYHINKMERGYNLSVNILGIDHQDEAKDVKAALAPLGYEPERLQHIIHEYVKVKKDGELRKGSTRSGDIVAVDEVLDEIAAEVGEQFAVDVIRYFFLVKGRKTEIEFDQNEAIKKSNENDVYYIQNAHVRSAGIARQAAEKGIVYEGGDVSLLTDPREISLIKKMIELPEVIERAVAELEPHKVAYWAHEELSSTFHSTYDEIRALHGEVPEELAKARLKLYAAAQIVFKRVLGLMGMSAPERM